MVHTRMYQDVMKVLVVRYLRMCYAGIIQVGYLQSRGEQIPAGWGYDPEGDEDGYFVWPKKNNWKDQHKQYLW